MMNSSLSIPQERQQSVACCQLLQREQFYPSARSLVRMPSSSLFYSSNKDPWALPESDEETCRDYSSTCSFDEEQDNTYEVPPLIRKVVEPNVNTPRRQRRCRTTRPRGGGRGSTCTRRVHLSSSSLVGGGGCGMMLPIVDCGGLIQEAIHKMKQKREINRSKKRRCRRRHLQQRLHAMS